MATTEYGLDSFFTNSSTSPKKVYDVAGVLGWSPHNMCLQSQTFDQTTPWNPTTAVTVTADAIAAPDATLTADKLVEVANSSNHQVLHANVTAIVGASYTVSVYAKAAERSWLSINLANGDTIADWFDLANGVMGATANGGTIISVGSGWYRCTITKAATISSVGPTFYIRTANNQTAVYAGTAGNGIYLWGAQLNRGSVPTVYLPTTTTARFGLALEYDPVTHAPRGLLCEPAATNVMISSDDLANATYWTMAGGTVAKNVVSPNGGTEGTTFTEDTTTAAHNVLNASGNRPTLTAVPYAFSVFLKAGTRRYVNISVESSGNGFNVTVDTQTWTITNNVNTGTGWTYASSSIQDVGGGWRRVSVIGTPAAASTIMFIGGNTTPTGGRSESYLGNGSTIICWGAQIEVGSVATSLIPTYTASATRVSDGFPVTAASINYSPTAGNWWLEYSPVNISASNPRLLTNSGGTAYLATSAANIYLMNDGTSLNKTVGTLLNGSLHKVAIAFQSADRAVTGDGLAVATDTGQVTNWLAPVSFLLGGSGGTISHAYFRKLRYVPRRKTNAELVTETT